MEPFVLRSDKDEVVTLTLNRGERMNPLSSEMIDALQTELKALASDTSARAVVLAANGKAFSAGHDLKEMRAHQSEHAWQQKLFGDCNLMMLQLTQLRVPVIARVQGIATAAGCQLVSMCDLAVAASEARFALPGVNIGVFCTTPAVGVVRNIGRKRSMEMLMTGEMISSATALEWGLINRAVPAAKLDEEIAHFTDIIRGRSREVIAEGKRAFYEQVDRPLPGAYAVAGESMARGLLHQDAAEGMDAFIGKRPAK
ncbi:MAG TPA: enoyl-CoA hydratase, partial [Myxococcales bacterium]|nr:enoyl-CoA hydratase [Myxococcales bacterium]